VKRKITPYLFLIPSLIGVFVFAIIPFTGVIKRSVSDSTNTEFVGVKNFSDIFQNQAFSLAAKNTVCFIIISLVLVVFCSLFLAMLLMKIGKIGKIMKSIYLMPLAIPVAALVVFWNMLFHNNGILNGILHFFHIRDIAWIDSKYSFWVLVLLFFWKNLGLSVLLWIIGISSVSSEQIEAAKLDGANSSKLFRKIILPDIKESIYTLLLLLLIHSFKIYRESYLLAGDYPNEGMYMLQNIMNNWFRNFDLGKMAASGIVCAVAVVILVIPLSRKLS